MLKKGKRKEYKNQYVSDDLDGDDFSYGVFIRLGGKSRKFNKVNFSYCVFDDCYLRKCEFTECNFTGAKFVGSHFIGSRFESCNFMYARFDKTEFDEDFLKTSAPSWENTKAAFARSLRINYRSLGDAKLEREAARMEIAAGLSHLYKAWSSNESYYRGKYKQWRRIQKFLQWLSMKSLSVIWGNGEKFVNLLRTTIAFAGICALVHFIWFNPSERSIMHALLEAPAILFNVSDVSFPGWMKSVIMFVRLSLFSLFITILVRRWGYR